MHYRFLSLAIYNMRVSYGVYNKLPFHGSTITVKVHALNGSYNLMRPKTR